MCLCDREGEVLNLCAVLIIIPMLGRPESKYERIDSTARRQTRILHTVSPTSWWKKAQGNLNIANHLSPPTPLTNPSNPPPPRLRQSPHPPPPPRTPRNPNLLAERPRKRPLHPLHRRPPPRSKRTSPLPPPPPPAATTHQSKNRAASRTQKPTRPHHRPRRLEPAAALESRTTQSGCAPPRLRNGGAAHPKIRGIPAGDMSVRAFPTAASDG